MRLQVISSAPIVQKDNQNYLYAPYENEIHLWAKHSDSIQFCCPIWRDDKKLLIAPISFEVNGINEIQEFDITSFFNKLKAVPLGMDAMVKIFKAMKQADHIHLRCPGNIALLACFVQILFPNKQKTAKYAGNWDPKAKQPWSYRLQKWILSNTFLTRNMQVLVYGEWEGSTKNIKAFFTATYAEADKVPLKSLNLKATIHFVFVGTLVKGKNPLYAIQIVEALFQNGYDVFLNMYGEGIERKFLENYIATNSLDNFIKLNGNQNQETIKKAYQNSHFVILPSKSEGWPKAVAEGMFWGCVPVATPISCVPFMLDYGNSGLLLQMNLKHDIQQLEDVLNNEIDYASKREKASEWSRNYSLDVFEGEIKKMLAK